MSKRMLDVSLLALTVIFLIFVALANEDPAARAALFGDALPEAAWHAKAVYKALYDVGVGGLVSLFFYLLLVRIPDNIKRRRIRRGLERQYKIFKEDCLYVMLGVVDGVVDPEKVDELLDQKAFRAYFQERPTPSQDRLDIFLNGLDETGLRQILSAVDILREEIAFALSATEIPTDEAFEFFKRFSGAIHAVKDTELGYDSIKPLSRFVWTLFSGFDFVTGYQKEDVVAKMIGSI
jgi:hypothetical protein